MEPRKGPLGGSTKMINSRQAADILGIALSTFQKRWRSFGIPHHMIGGTALRFMERDVQFYRDQCSGD
jgi:hypothetical protein